MLELPTSPDANEFKIAPRLTAARPLSVVNPLMPAEPVTSPVANAVVMVPLLDPTSPPPIPFEPTLTTTAAQVKPNPQGVVTAGTVTPATPPRFCPTRPPALLPLPTCTWPVAETLMIVPAFVPASVPANCELTL